MRGSPSRPTAVNYGWIMNRTTVHSGPRLVGHSLGDDWANQAKSMISIRITIRKEKADQYRYIW